MGVQQSFPRGTAARPGHFAGGFFTGFVEALEPRRLLAGEAVTQLFLVNADTDQLVGPLGTTVNFAQLGTNKLNIVAEAAGATESVRFALDANSNFRTENSAPYTLAGDSGSDYRSWTPTLGTHTVRATPYTADNAGGIAGTALAVTFEVINQAVVDPVALQVSASSIDFGDVAAGTVGQAVLTLTNPSAAGGSSVTVLSTDITGSATFTDTFNDATDVTLAPGQSTSITVRFAPTIAAGVAGTLNVRHSGTNSPVAVALSGNGLVTNRAPVLAAIGNKSVAAGQTLNVPVAASDPDGDATVLSATNLPAWATFTDNGNGTGSLVLAPPPGTSATINGVVITATDDGDPVLSDSETISLTSTSTNVAVTRLMLWRADTDVELRPLVNNDVINFAAIGTNRLSVVAEVTTATGSVRFSLDANNNFRTENNAPYTIAGENGTNINAWTPSLGSHTLRVTPYSADNAGGTAGAPVEIAFQVVNQLVTDPVAVQASLTSIDFGSVDVGTTKEVLLTLTNPGAPGGASVTIQSTDVTGAAAFGDDFNDAGDVTLAPGQSVTLKVRFAPTAGGPVTGTLNVRHSGTNNPLAIALGGTGVAVVTNTAPVLAPIGNKQVLPGGTLSVPISATDADGDAIGLSASSLPAWATFTDNGNGTGWIVLNPPAGTSGTFNGVVITATDDGSPVLSDSETIAINVSDSGVIVHKLTLINADTDQPIGDLFNGRVISRAVEGTSNFNVVAITSAGTKSVRFGLDGTANHRTESSAPFTLFGDTAGNYAAWAAPLGSHTVTATPFSATGASGTAGAPLVVTFSVVQGATLVASPTTVTVSAAQGGGTASRTVTVGTNDGTSAAYAATSDSLWLRVGSATGTTGNPLTLTVDTTGLSVGNHTGYVTLKSATHGGVRLPVTLTVTGSFVADQVHLSFVQDPTTTMTVVWRTMSTSTPSTVEYRALGSSTWLSTSGGLRDSGTTGTLHETSLLGLSPATTYEYRVRGDNAAWSPVFTTRTMPPAGPADFDLVFFGDTGLLGRADGLDTGTAQAIKEMLGLNPDLILPGGDYAYYNTDQRYGTLDNSIDAWFNQNQPLFSRVPIMPTYGNHEVLLGESYDRWAERFATPQGWNGQQNYSFDVGDVHFVSILAVSDTTALPSSSLTWLRNDLAAARADAGTKWIVPYMHVPAFADGSSHPSNTALRAQLGPVFEQYGVQVVLASHDQSYERTYPLTGVPNNITRTSTSLSGYDESDGVTWIKVSPAGKLSNKSGADNFSKFQTFPAPFWTASRDDTMHHFSRLTFTANGTLRVDTYGFSGDGTPAAIIDSFEYNIGGAGAALTAAAPRDGSVDALDTEANTLYAWGGTDFAWGLSDRISVDGLDGVEGDEELVGASL
jgi:acid phosphatase type 7